MSKSLTTLALSAVLAVPALLTHTAAVAREGNSMGHGVKCYWVVVSSVNGVNTMQQVCRKGV